VTEETTTGVHRLYQLAQAGTADPGDQRQRLGHQEQVRQPVRLPRVAGRRLKRAMDVMLAGKVAVVCGYGDVGKGCAHRCVPTARA
jgi:adenosylhomocysteinase